MTALLSSPCRPRRASNSLRISLKEKKSSASFDFRMLQSKKRSSWFMMLLCWGWWLVGSLDPTGWVCRMLPSLIVTPVFSCSMMTNILNNSRTLESPAVTVHWHSISEWLHSLPWMFLSVDCTHTAHPHRRVITAASTRLMEAVYVLRGDKKNFQRERMTQQPPRNDSTVVSLCA